MKLTDEIFNESIKNKSKFQKLNDEYVILYKKMPIEDEKLEWYINMVNTAHDAGINTPSITDYKMVLGTTSSYSNGTSYTTGVFIEELAKGNSLDSCNFYDEKDFSKEEYISETEKYIEEIERRSNADINQFLKFLNDYNDLKKYGLCSDPKYTNFMYDSDVGFTIIDVIPYNANFKDDEYFSQYIFGICFGYGRPKVYFNNENYMPDELFERYEKAYINLEKKIVDSLIIYGVPMELIESNLKRVNSIHVDFSYIDSISKLESYNYNTKSL